MKKGPVTLSVFFPTYNEEANIRQTVEQTISVVENNSRISEYEIIIVDDGSKDATPRIADELAATYPTVRVVHHEVNKGYGSALKTGIDAATKEYVFFTDADLQFDILELQDLINEVPEYQAVIGYRAPRRDPFMRLVNAWGWKQLNRFLFGLKVQDIDCAFKLFRRELIQNIPLRSTGAMVSAEMLIRISRMNVAIKEVRVTHLPRVAGNPTGAKLSVIFRAFKELIHLFNVELGSLTQKQAIKFAMVGVLNTLVDFVAYFLISRGIPYFHDQVTLTRLVSYLVGTVCSYFLNRSFTFQVRHKIHFLEVVRFYSVIVLSLIISLAVMTFLTNVLGIYDLIAFPISTIFTFAVSFTTSKLWVFIQKSDNRQATVNTQYTSS